MSTTQTHAVYLPAPADETVGPTAGAADPLVIELTTENYTSMRSEDGFSPLDFIDLPEQQVERYGRVVVRRATIEEDGQ